MVKCLLEEDQEVIYLNPLIMKFEF